MASSVVLGPHKALVLAVLEAAIYDYSVGPSSTQHSRRTRRYLDAVIWLTDTRSDHPMSVRWVCERLGLDVMGLANRVRQRLPISRIPRSPAVR